MNHPEHKHIIVFDGNVFEIGNIVDVKTKSEINLIRGRIIDIGARTFSLDASR